MIDAIKYECYVYREIEQAQAQGLNFVVYHTVWVYDATLTPTKSNQPTDRPSVINDR